MVLILRIVATLIVQDVIAPTSPTLISSSNNEVTNNNEPPFGWSDVTDLSSLVNYNLRWIA